MTHIVKITAENPALATLKLQWGRPEYTAEDGIGSLDNLYQGGDAVVAVAGYFNEQLLMIGSGVMIAPGLMLTATHVLDEFPRTGSGPVLLSFLLDGAARAWLPTATVNCIGKSNLGVLDETIKIVSDLSLVSCSLHSDAFPKSPLSLAPIELCLPIPGTRLWAVGFRQCVVEDGPTKVSPLVTSGLVTACFPNGRGERMPSPCIEVEMETIGGMSGGPVYNEDGRLVGVVSSSFDGGPTYITLVWDAMRISIEQLPKDIWPSRTSDLFSAMELGLVRIQGKVQRDAEWNVNLTLSDEEMAVLISS